MTDPTAQLSERAQLVLHWLGRWDDNAVTGVVELLEFARRRDEDALS